MYIDYIRQYCIQLRFRELLAEPMVVISNWVSPPSVISSTRLSANDEVLSATIHGAVCVGFYDQISVAGPEYCFIDLITSTVSNLCVYRLVLQ